MKCNWNKISIKNAPLQIIDGDRGKNYPHQGDYYSNEYCLFLNTSNVSNNGFDFSECQFITKQKDDLLSKGKLKRGDIVLTTRGTIGNVGFFKNTIEMQNIRINSGMLILRPENDKLLSNYLYLYLRSDIFRKQTIAFQSGSAQPQLPIKDLTQIKIQYPSIKTQKKIAGVLAAFDELIEVNRRKIKILEEMAQAIYKEWFVKMKFPGHKKFAPPIGNGDGTAPYRVFDSPLGPIPEGWEVKNLRDFGTVVTGKTPPKNEVEYYGSYMPFIKIPDMHEYPFCIKTSDNLSEKGVSTQKNKILPPNSLCVSCIGTAGLVTITTVQSMTNQQINSLIINNFMLREFLYFALLNLKGLIELYGMNGATMTNLNKSKFENLEIIYPSKEVLISFNSNEKPIFDLIKSFEYSIDYLSSLRDLLLPKLISGKIDVSELDIDQYALGDS